MLFFTILKKIKVRPDKSSYNLNQRLIVRVTPIIGNHRHLNAHSTYKVGTFYKTKDAVYCAIFDNKFWV